MKKVISCLLFFALLIIVPLTAYANETIQDVFYFGDLDVEIVFESDSSLSEEEKERIAEILAYDLSTSETRAWCWLTGHDKVIHTVTKVTHKATPYAPRCLEETYNITTCENCSYYYEDLIAQEYTFCCPEE